MFILRLGLVIVGSLVSTTLFAQANPEPRGKVESCLDQAVSELEKAYCEVIALDINAKLPPFGEFKRNPPATQHLLLKRPAQRVGIVLPKAPPKKPRYAPRSQDKTPKRIVHKRPKAEPKLAVSSDLSGCGLKKNAIRCSGMRYLLVNNQANSTLEEDVLTDENRLVFPPFPAGSRSTEAINNYLADCYTRYIERMVSIGLAGSTMPYTRFYYIYENAVEQKLDFSERFATMFAYLKKDKAQLGVKNRYGEQFPKSIKQCMVLNKQLIVCDNGKANWVYKKG